MNIAILGGVFGDEAKGSMTHHLSPNFNWVIRYGSGANAGHTLYRDGKKYVHNLLPSVDFRNPNIKSFLGAGMVIDLLQLIIEIERASIDFPNVGNTIFVDPDAFIVTTEHKKTDKQTNGHIGSTNRGIGPAYLDKISRKGTRVCDLLAGEEVNKLKSLGVQFKRALSLRSEFEKSKLIFEGAQGILLDINHGTYPYVTSTDCTVSGIGPAGFNWAKIDEVYGVVKVYSTRVGEGPFPTEYHGAEAETLRILGKEFGATTGRPRRVGALDLPALRYAILKGGINALILTKFDILDGAPSVKVCTDYDKDPVCGQDFFDANPKYFEHPGWQDANILDNSVLDFVRFVEKQVGVPVKFISCGTDISNIYKL